MTIDAIVGKFKGLFRKHGQSPQDREWYDPKSVSGGFVAQLDSNWRS